MNVLEDFWYGNLDPAEYDANPSKEYKELVRLISRNEEKLLATGIPISSSSNSLTKWPALPKSGKMRFLASWTQKIKMHWTHASE